MSRSQYNFGENHKIALADRACETFHYLIGLCVRRQGPVSCFRAAGESWQVRLIECRALMCAEE
ncbi:MAG TPA: hypothetical protein IAB55_05295 [Candidatus Merdivicinus faecavium]|nr:hypothetical protein [Candidatus Merdivicinus faecavium]